MSEQNGSDTAPATEGTIETAADSIRKKMDAQAQEQPGAETQPSGQGAQEAATADDGEQELPAGDPGNANEAEVEDAGEEPTIQPPAGFTAEEKAWFETLEPARQEAVLRQIKGTQAAEARRQNEHNTAMQRLEQEHHQAATERQYLATAIQQYADPLWAQYQRDFADVLRGVTNPVMLSRENPQRFSEYMAYQEQFRSIDQARSHLHQQGQADEEKAARHFRTAENERLVELMPELQDKAKFDRFDVDVSNYLTGLGIQPERVFRASAQELTLAHKAMLWDRAQAASKSATQKSGGQAEPGKVVVQQHQRTAPKVLKPGNGGNATLGAAEKGAALAQQARKSGSIDDVAASIRFKMDQQEAARRNR